MGERARRTICWDCENAVEPEICPWCGSGSPVPGWIARPTVIKANIVVKYKDSYVVEYCPLFKRDAVKWGRLYWKEGWPL